MVVDFPKVQRKRDNLSSEISCGNFFAGNLMREIWCGKFDVGNLMREIQKDFKPSMDLWTVKKICVSRIRIRALGRG